MIEPKIPKNENKRLATLKSYEILNTLPESDYDEITRIASLICKTPIALISLVSEDEQFFKSKQGIDASRTPRNISFCGHAIHNPNELFIVNNASKDKRFFDNPLVSDYPNIAFYAGAPLVSPKGYALGTLCVIDDKPKELNDEQIQSLKALANQTMKLFELRKNNKILKKNLKKEKELSELKSLFVATASHQFRTPMSIIQSNSELLTMLTQNSDGNLKTKFKKTTNRIQKEVKRMTELIDDILILEKITSKKITPKKKTIDIVSLCQDLSDRYSIIQSDKRTVNYSYSGDVKAIKINPTLISHAISNLLSNAFKYSSNSNPKLQLLFKEKTLDIIVSDDGIGIPESDIKNLYQAFYRAENAQNIPGTGLGLAITKEYIELNGGKINLETKLNIGTKFTITLNY